MFRFIFLFLFSFSFAQHVPLVIAVAHHSNESVQVTFDVDSTSQEIPLDDESASNGPSHEDFADEDKTDLDDYLGNDLLTPSLIAFSHMNKAPLALNELALELELPPPEV